MTEISDKHLDALQNLLTSPDFAELEERIVAFRSALPKQQAGKQQILDYLVQQLNKNNNSPRERCGYLVALAEFDSSEAAALINKHLDTEFEPSDRVQYRAAVSLSRISPPDLQEHLEKALGSLLNGRVKATILRLLIQHNSDEPETQEQYIQQMLNMALDGNGDHSWAVLRALRNEDPAIQPLPVEIEDRFMIEFVTPRLKDEDEWIDVRIQAALALGDVEHDWAEAIDVLTSVYKRNPPDALRRYCIQSLCTLGTRLNKREIQTAMLLALEDSDVGIQNIATDALHRVLKPKAAVEFIVAALLQKEDIPNGYIQALRQIDKDKATNKLSESFLDPDPKRETVALKALTRLGGKLALEKLLAQKRKYVDKYTELLSNSDSQIMAQHKQLIGEAQVGFRTSLFMHRTVFALGVIMFVVTILLVLGGGSNEPVALLIKLASGGIGGFLGIYLSLFYRNPIQNIRVSTADLTKIDITFLSYMRQINLIDATFKQLYINTHGFGLEQMNEMIAQIQSVVNQSLDDVHKHIYPVQIDEIDEA